jgi:hypothetical protein
LVNAGVVGAVAVVPGATVHIHDGGKRSAPFGPIDTSQPGFASDALILEIPHFYFEFIVGIHGRNLQDAGGDPQGLHRRPAVCHDLATKE